MSWLIYALSGPVMWALSVHIDKYLIGRYFKHGNVAALMVFTALAGFLVMPAIWFFRPDAVFLPWQAAAVVSVSGILSMAAIYFYMQALQIEEASSVAPFFQVSAVFGLILGYIFLGEKLNFWQIIGVLLIVAGSVAISLRQGKDASRFKAKMAVLMLACAFALSLSSLIFKFFAVQDDFWKTVFWSYSGDVVFGAGLMCIPSVRRRFFEMFRENIKAVLSVTAANEFIYLGGSLGASYALLLAPLGAVQAVSSTTPFFVLFFGALISIFLPKLGREEIGFGGFLRKFIAIVLVVAGVLLIG